MKTYNIYETIPEENYYLDGLELKREEFEVLKIKHYQHPQPDEHIFEYDFFLEDAIEKYPDWN